jgi:hypothetical protein
VHLLSKWRARRPLRSSVTTPSMNGHSTTAHRLFRRSCATSQPTDKGHSKGSTECKTHNATGATARGPASIQPAKIKRKKCPANPSEICCSGPQAHTVKAARQEGNTETSNTSSEQQGARCARGHRCLGTDVINRRATAAVRSEDCGCRELRATAEREDVQRRPLPSPP